MDPEPPPAELAKARNQALAAFWHGLETISGKAQALGTFEVFQGDYHKMFDMPAEYASITADDLKQVASQVLTVNNRTVGVVVPKVDGAQGGAQ